MSDKLKAIIERIDEWPPEAQEEAAASLRAIEQGLVETLQLSAGDRAALELSAEDVRSGRFATGEQVARALRHRSA